MSTHILNIVPTDPWFVPDTNTHDEALSFVKGIFTYKYIEFQVKVYERPMFMCHIIEEVNCPYSGVDVYEWWAKVLDNRWEENRFQILEVNTPCCEKQSTLNDLVYVPDAGFARFIIEIRDPVVPNNGDIPFGAESLVLLPSIGTVLPCQLSESGIAEVSRILKCDIRQIGIVI